VDFSDEMRLGLLGTVRRVLAPRGVKVVQCVQLKYEYRYLLLAVSPAAGTLRWEWITRMNAEQLLPVFTRWKLRAVVWDGAPGHRAQAMDVLATARILLPPYSPELNPAERVFEEVRRHTEGKVYDSLDAKQQAAGAFLQELRRDPERVKRLCNWEWINEALRTLPPSTPQPE
jgi:transposase